jgi:hypothetical protein
MKPVNWIKIQNQWNHLRKIPFPKLGSRGIVDVLLGTDHYHLMFSKEEVLGKESEPSARLCPLGWTAVGAISSNDAKQDRNTRFHYTFRACADDKTPLLENKPDDVNAMVKKFWDLETMGILPASEKPRTRTPDETLADRGTRGLTAKELKNDECWWQGPKFLEKPENEWPERKFGSPSLTAREEVKTEPETKAKSTFYNQSAQTQTKATWRLDPARYSKWYRTNPRHGVEISYSLVRIRSWVQRFVDNARKTKDERNNGRELTPTELAKTEINIIRTAQQESFPEEMKAIGRGNNLPVKSPKIRHTPVLTEEVLRSDTRLRYSDDLPEETKYPIILPENHPVTKLIVKYHHEKEGHEMGI